MIVYVPIGVERSTDTVSVELEYGPTVVGTDTLSPFFAIGEMAVLRLTVPLKPFTPLMVIVKVAEEFRVIVWLVGVALIAKSGVPVIVTETLVVRDNVPLVPLTVTAKNPEGVELVDDIVRVAVAEPPLTNTEAGLTVKVRPGELGADSVTVPTNPLIAVTVIVDVAVAPATKLKLTGLATRLKSVTMKVTETAWLREPLVPVTVTA